MATRLFIPTDDAATWAWHDGSDSSTITSSAGAISQVNDKSGNGRHITQASSGAQPTVLGSALNGMSGIDLRSGKSLISAAGLTLAQPFTVIAVITSFPASPAFSHLFEGDVGYGYTVGSRAIGMLRRPEQSNQPSAFGGGSIKSIGSVLTANDPYLLTWTFQGSGSPGGVNNTFITASGDIGSNAIANGFAYGDNGSADNWSNCVLLEAVIMSTADATRVQKMGSALAWKWGLQADLPADDPYKAAAPTVDTGGGAIAYTESLTEAGNASDSLTGAAAFNVSRSEAGSAGDTLGAMVGLAAALTEPAAVADAILTSNALAATLSELASASDALTTQASLTAVTSAAATASDSTSLAGSTYSVALTEAANANDLASLGSGVVPANPGIGPWSGTYGLLPEKKRKRVETKYEPDTLRDELKAAFAALSGQAPPHAVSAALLDVRPAPTSIERKHSKALAEALVPNSAFGRRTHFDLRALAAEYAARAQAIQADRALAYAHDQARRLEIEAFRVQAELEIEALRFQADLDDDDEAVALLLAA